MNRINNLPYIGFVFRWLYSFIRLSNTRHGFLMMQQEVNILKSEIGSLKSEIGSLKSEIGSLKSEIGSLKSEVSLQLQSQKNDMPSLISKEIYYQSKSFQQQIDQFVFDANIELKTKIIDH